MSIVINKEYINRSLSGFADRNVKYRFSILYQTIQRDLHDNGEVYTINKWISLCEMVDDNEFDYANLRKILDKIYCSLDDSIVKNEILHIMENIEIEYFKIRSRV